MVDVVEACASEDDGKVKFACVGWDKILCVWCDVFVLDVDVDGAIRSRL